VATGGGSVDGLDHAGGDCQRRGGGVLRDGGDGDCPGPDGRGRHHAAPLQFLTELKPGEVRVKLPGGEEESFYVSGGFLEVLPHVVTVLSDTGLRAKDLDEAKALEAKSSAERALADRSAKIDYAKAQAELAEAMRNSRPFSACARN